MLLPALGKARSRARLITCVNVQKQLGTLIHMYGINFGDQAPIAFGVLGCGEYYGYACDDRAGNWIRYAGINMGLMKLYETGLDKQGQLLFCPSLLASDWGGRDHAGRGWNPTAGYGLCSFYYRYANLSPSVGVFASCGGVNEVNQYRANLSYLSKNYPAALWDSVHDVTSCCGGQNQGYHREGFNILFYAGSAKTMPGKYWHPSYWPANVWWDWTDCWGYGSPTFTVYADRFYKEM